MKVRHSGQWKEAEILVNRNGNWVSPETSVKHEGEWVSMITLPPENEWIIFDAKDFDPEDTFSNLETTGCIGSVYLFTTKNGYAYITYDYGNNWRELPQNLNSGSPGGHDGVSILPIGESTLIATFSAGYASISNDSGKTWSALPKGLNCGNQSATLYLAGDSTAIIAAGSGKYGSISNDSGVTWNKVEFLNSSFENPYSVANVGDTFIVGYRNGISSISRDNGKRWEEFLRGLGIPGYNNSAIELTSDNKTFLAALSGYPPALALSSNGGEKFELIETPNDLEISSITGISISGSKIIIGCHSSYGPVSLLSENLGNNWVKINKTFSSGIFGICVNDAGIYLAGCNSSKMEATICNNPHP